MTLELPGEPPLDGLFLCLVSNVAPWTYLGARPVNPSPEASFDTGLDVFAMGRMGVFRMLHHVRQVLARRPDARGRGVHRRHDLAGVTLTHGGHAILVTNGGMVNVAGSAFIGNSMFTSAPSVISRRNRVGSAPAVSSSRSRRSAKSTERKCRGETLTDT